MNLKTSSKLLKFNGSTMHINEILIFVLCVIVVSFSDRLYTDPEGPIIWIQYFKPINISCWSTSNRETNVTWLNGVLLSGRRNFKSTREVLYNGTDITTKLTVFIKHSEFNYSGNYTCTDGTLSKSIKVNVINGKIKLRPSSDRIVTFVNETISLLCEYEGHTKLDIYWLKDDITPVENLSFTSNRQTITGHKIKTTMEVTKRDLKLHDAGDYFCYAGPFSKKVTLEIYPGLCNVSLLTGSFGVADSHITASTYYEDVLYSDLPNRARLNTERETQLKTGSTGQSKYYGGAWAPKINDKKQWIMVKLQKLSVIRKILTQGRSSTDCCAQEHWVKSFKFKYSQNNITWYKYKDTLGNAMIFSGNYDHNTIRINLLPVPVIAQYLQINPVSWNERIAMRFDVIGCFLPPSDIRVLQPKSGSLSLEIPASLHLSCQFLGPGQSMITWYKDGRDVSQNIAYIRKSVFTDIDGQDKVIASIHKVVTDSSDSGNYMCRENKSGRNKSISVHIAKLEMQPKTGQYWAVASQPLNISCTYKGAELKDVNWSYNGEIPVFRKKLETRSNENGVYSLSGIFKSKADMSDSGNYTCSVGDFNRTLSVRVIKVTTSISSNTVTVGKSITLRCSIFGIPANVKFDAFWSKETIPIKNIQSLNGRYKYYPYTLIIQNAEISDAGTYECNVLLEVNSTYQQNLFVTTELLATPEAKIDGQKTVKSGESLHLYCKTTGYPKPHIIWYKGKKELNEKTSRITFLPYAGSSNGHLVVFDVTIDDANEYSCEGVANGFSPVKSSMDIEITESENGNNILLIIVIAVCTTCLIIVILFVACCVRCQRRRAMTKSPDALENLARNRPQITKMYVDMKTGSRQPRSVSEEEIRMLPIAPAPAPDGLSFNTYRTSEDGSATYETFRHSTDNTTVKSYGITDNDI